MITKILLLFLSFFCLLGTAEQNNSEAELIEGASGITQQKTETQTKQQKQLPSDTPSAQTKTNKNSMISTEAVSNKTKKHKESDAFLERKTLAEGVSNNSNRFLELGLEYPINFGIHLKYLFSSSAYARLGLGFMPSFFLDSFQKLSPSFGYLNEEEAKLISDTFQNSMYIDFRLAWSPYVKESGGGPYLEVGLSRILYGKGELKGSHLSKVITDNSFDELASYSAKTNTYNATAHIGYQIPFEKVKLNIEVGLIKILHTDILSETSSVASKLLTEQQKQSFKNFLKKKGWIFPTISGWISFSF